MRAIHHHGTAAGGVFVLGRLLLVGFVLIHPPSTTLALSSSSATQPPTSTSQEQQPSIGQAIQDAANAHDLLCIAEHRIWNVGDKDLPSPYLHQNVHHERRQRWSAQWWERWAACQEATTSTAAPCLERVLRGIADPGLINDRPDKEGRWISQALVAIHRCVGYRCPHTIQLLQRTDDAAFTQFVQRINAMANDLPLEQAVTTRWAIRGIVARTATLDATLSWNALDTRVQSLPFDILPHQLHWNEVLPLNETDTAVSFLRRVLPLAREPITTRRGSTVTERRATAWCTTCATIGALAYSGKLMAPQPLPPCLHPVLRRVEQAIQDTTTVFDAVLCNDYPDATAACAFHTDPEHGTVWDRTTCVVAAGAMRRFAFRSSIVHPASDPMVADLFAGDIVHMWGDCNDCYEHAVYTGTTASDDDDQGRVSFVLKRALDRGGGRKGHGLPGRGRRSKRKYCTDAKSSTAPKKVKKKRSERP